ncbi:MAG: MBOAT family protein [Paludibacteraceae bacterium]|nr:MBOAT family protein [Paludibacteraceae bacterium]
MSFLHHIFAFDSASPLLFTQFYFWAFFAIIYAVFALILEVNNRQGEADGRKRLHLRNVFLMFVSWFFYYKTSGIFLLILAFVTCSDFLIAKRIAQLKQPKINIKKHLRRNVTLPTDYTALKRRLWLVLSVAIDLGLLAYFKYAYFFTDMLNGLFGADFRVFDIFAYVGNGFAADGRFMVDTIVLPVGISFYIFQVISYTADVYHERIRPVDNLLDFGFYVSFFPQLVAGPIVRASEFIPQLYKPFRLTKMQFGIALFWILNGLAKKIILSDYLAVNFIDRVFQSPMLFSGFENLFALLTYSMQVYADFSGYTDIAIGVALLMGFYLPQNFDSPYKSQNPQEFWRRWHMSLSRWLKTYLYIPLGGNRNATFGTYFWITLIALVALVLTGSWVATAVILIVAAVVIVVALLRPSHRQLLYANLNSFITMLLGGLWHGASWNFMIWGGLNGIGMILNKFWRIMNWHVRFAIMTLLALSFAIAHHFAPLPLINLAYVWFAILWVGTAIRYIWNLCVANRFIIQVRVAKAVNALGVAWAVLQTFVFISFTRLFFRSGSNLNPATANQEAWQTAKQMVGQIGGAWNSSIIPDFLWEYRSVVVLFVAGMIIHWLPARWKRWYRINFAMLPLWVMLLIVVVAVFVIYQFVTADLQAFIYFQF